MMAISLDVWLATDEEDTSREPERKGSLEGWEGWQAW